MVRSTANTEHIMLQTVARKWSGGLMVFGLLMMVVITTACHRNEKATAQGRHSAWSALIAGHTNGIVSRKSEVRILFANDVTPEAGTLDPRKVLSIDPAVDGDIQFRGARELALTPSKELEPGKTYTVTVEPQGLKGIPQDIAPYVF